ncbi:MAG: cysteine desulfurase [Hyphomicrobiaceae bacterium]|nr:cysteine desulfurase [Hyphomicrobiaceae bacterium]
MSPRVYLDYNATALLRPEVRAAMTEAFSVYGNPSSVHEEGRKARAAVERARAQVAALAGCEPGEVIFTSGASEANQTVINAGWDFIAVSAMEHESVLSAAYKAVGLSSDRVNEIPALMDGQVACSEFELTRDSYARSGSEFSNPLVSVQLANGEIGVVQPVDRIVEIAFEQGYRVHTDAVQAAGRIPLDFAELNVDFMSLSAHKIGGPKGSGALIVRRGCKMPSLMHGGGQEAGRRAGTENVSGIVGFGAAAECALRDLEQMSELRSMRDRLEREASAMSNTVNVFSATPGRLPNTSAIALSGSKAETLVISLDLAGIAVSAGSACSSGKVSRSHVLQAVNAPPEVIDSTIRVSMGWDTKDSDIDRFLDAWAGIVKQHDERRDVA